MRKTVKSQKGDAHMDIRHCEEIFKHYGGMMRTKEPRIFGS